MLQRTRMHVCFPRKQRYVSILFVGIVSSFVSPSLLRIAPYDPRFVEGVVRRDGPAALPVLLRAVEGVARPRRLRRAALLVHGAPERLPVRGERLAQPEGPLLRCRVWKEGEDSQVKRFASAPLSGNEVPVINCQVYSSAPSAARVMLIVAGVVSTKGRRSSGVSRAER